MFKLNNNNSLLHRDHSMIIEFQNSKFSIENTEQKITQKLNFLANEHLKKFPKDVSHVDDLTKRQAFIKHYFNFRECYNFLKRSIYLKENGGDDRSSFRSNLSNSISVRSGNSS